jgi:Zn-dependent protease with chaperone function
MNTHRLLKALAVALAIPLTCAVLSTSARADWDRRWEAGLWRQFAARRHPVNQRIVARYSLAAICSDSRTVATFRPCRTYNLLRAGTTASIATGGLGLLLVAAIVAGGAVARRRRRLLYRMYRAALSLVVAAVALLVVAHAVLGVATLSLALGDSLPGSIVLAVAAGALLVALSASRAAFSLTRPLGFTVIGRRLDMAVQPALRSAIADLADRLGGVVPDAVVAGTTPGLFVTGAEVMTLDGPTSGRVLYCSLPLARILAVDEWRALVAHELAHLAGSDKDASGFLLAAAGVARGVRLLERRAGALRGVAVLPVLWIARLFAGSFSLEDASLNSAREHGADRAAAAVVGPRALASALVKVHVFAPAWATVRGAMDRAVVEGTQYVSVSELFAEVVAANSGPERLVGIAGRSLTHPTDSLPPLGERLATLAVDPPAVAVSALETRPVPAAISLFQAIDGVERDLSEVEHRLLARERAADALSSTAA